MRISSIGHLIFGLFAVMLAGFGLFYGDMALVASPLPGAKILTYGFGAILLVASLGLFFARTILVSAIVIAVYAVAWAVATTGPIFHAPLSIGSWYGLSEAVAILVGAWTLYALEWRRRPAPATTMTGKGALRVAQGLFGAACVVYDVAHFAYDAYTEPFVPTWLPARMALVYVTGACHTAAGVALITGVFARLAATLEAIMITTFGLWVWLPSFIPTPPPKFAGDPHNHWVETLLTFLLAGTAWLVVEGLRPGNSKSQTPSAK